ncbi:hypothetical protein GWK47_019472 [Chionoecetes opilio]|uniref:Uncharacterized protein n=1 Tax=Chionoecetes opilio TaxID=41210 RepID=A0A8J5BX87_CHIOP|nr:hypothetical protein GWK47_019472 [Chionoecetes opilio]
MSHVLLYIKLVFPCFLPCFGVVCVSEILETSGSNSLRLLPCSHPKDTKGVLRAAPLAVNVWPVNSYQRYYFLLLQQPLKVVPTSEDHHDAYKKAEAQENVGITKVKSTVYRHGNEAAVVMDLECLRPLRARQDSRHFEDPDERRKQAGGAADKGAPRIMLVSVCRAAQVSATRHSRSAAQPRKCSPIVALDPTFQGTLDESMITYLYIHLRFRSLGPRGESVLADVHGSFRCPPVYGRSQCSVEVQCQDHRLFCSGKPDIHGAVSVVSGPPPPPQVTELDAVAVNLRRNQPSASRQQEISWSVHVNTAVQCDAQASDSYSVVSGPTPHAQRNVAGRCRCESFCSKLTLSIPTCSHGDKGP